MANESGGGGSSGNQPDTYRERQASIPDVRESALDAGLGEPDGFFTHDAAKWWINEYQRRYGNYDPLRADAFFDPTIVDQGDRSLPGGGPDYGVNIDPTIRDPAYVDIGIDSWLDDRRANSHEWHTDYTAMGQELERRHQETVALAHQVFLQRQQVRHMEQLNAMVVEIWKQFYPERDLPYAQRGQDAAKGRNRSDASPQPAKVKQQAAQQQRATRMSE